MTVNGTARAAMATDPDLGAGNFLATVRQNRPGDEEVLWADEGVFTLDRLTGLVETYAGWFHARGVVPRDPVVVYTGSALEYALCFLALSTLGAVAALVNGDLSADLAREYTRRIGAVAAFGDAEHMAALQGTDLPATATAADVTAGPLPAGYPYRHDAMDPVLITHTSATTGMPKAVCVSHGSFFAGTRYRLGLPLPQGHERVLSALPGAHNSAVTVIMQSFLNGLPVRILSERKAETVVAAIADFRPTMVAAFAATYADLARHELPERDLASVVLWYNSGDSAHRTHIDRLVERGHHTEVSADGRREVAGSFFHDGLGSSEMGHSLFYAVHRKGARLEPRCVGKPYEFVEAAVLAEDGTPLPDGEVGRLGVRSPSITPAYWNDTATYYRSFLAGYWLTGDLVYRNERGLYFHVDRVPDAIRTDDGVLYSVWAEELLLESCAELKDCTVFGVRGRACAVLTFRERDVPLDGWVDRVNTVLAGHGMPAAVVRVLDADRAPLPVGPTGKVQKRVLRERHEQLVAGDVTT